MLKDSKHNKLPPLNLYILCTLRNTILTIVDQSKQSNKVIYQTSSRRYPSNIKRKNNAYTLQKISFKLIDFLIKYLVEEESIPINIIIKGIGAGRYNIIKNISKNKQIKIIKVKDLTPIPFNGCRSKKSKRR